MTRITELEEEMDKILVLLKNDNLSERARDELEVALREKTIEYSRLYKDRQ